MAGVLFRLGVVADAYEEHVSGILLQFSGILSAFDLADGAVDIVVVFQLYKQGGRVYVLAGYEYQVGEALDGGQFAEDHIIVLGIIVGYAEHTGHRVLVVVRQDAGVLVVSGLDACRHSFLVAIEGGL